MQACIARIEALNPAVNAIAATGFERALQQARAAEAQVLRGDPLPPLHGLPLGVKDLHLVTAQHLEGGPQAQLYVNAGGRAREWVGGLPTAYRENEGNVIAWPVPNVIGVRKK